MPADATPIELVEDTIGEVFCPLGFSGIDDETLEDILSLTSRTDAPKMLPDSRPKERKKPLVVDKIRIIIIQKVTYH